MVHIGGLFVKLEDKIGSDFNVFLWNCAVVSMYTALSTL